MKKLFAAASALAIAAGAAYVPVKETPAAAAEIIGYRGDVNTDMNVNIADVVKLQRTLLGDDTLSEDGIWWADLDADGYIDAFDLTLLRQIVMGLREPEAVYSGEADFIDPPIYDLYGTLPSQGPARLCIFYVDFPDCKYSNEPSNEEIAQIAFGPQNSSDRNYPFESMTGFYERSSKGGMELSGEVYRYTAQYEKSYYENDVWKKNLVNEVMANMDSTVDFSQFDADSDGVIDAMLFSVPNAAGDDEWWPCAGQFGGDSRKKYDGTTIGHVITGNAEISSTTDYLEFNRTYLHEMGHCMGLPDFYLYNSGSDFEGLHGSAGYTLMDDATADFAAVSKLQLGWYRSDQIEVYSGGTQTYTLTNAQTDSGNCLVIPCGELDSNYQSEYMLVEYSTLDANNSYVGEYYWWRKTGSGVRVLHVEGTITGDYWYNTYTYSSGNDEATNNDAGKRFVRVIDDAEKDNLYHTGDVIDGNISGFHWYDQSGGQTVDTGITITVGEFTDGTVTVTVSGG